MQYIYAIIMILLVGGLYVKRGLNNKVRLTLMTIMFLGFILKISILPFISDRVTL